MSRAIFPLHFPDRHSAPQHFQRAGGGHRPRHRLRQQGGHAGVHRPHHLRRHRGRISPPEKSPSSCGWAALRWNWRRGRPPASGTWSAWYRRRRRPAPGLRPPLTPVPRTDPDSQRGGSKLPRGFRSGGKKLYHMKTGYKAFKAFHRIIAPSTSGFYGTGVHVGNRSSYKAKCRGPSEMGPGF